MPVHTWQTEGKAGDCKNISSRRWPPRRVVGWTRYQRVSLQILSCVDTEKEEEGNELCSLKRNALSFFHYTLCSLKLHETTRLVIIMHLFSIILQHKRHVYTRPLLLQTQVHKQLTRQKSAQKQVCKSQRRMGDSQSQCFSHNITCSIFCQTELLIWNIIQYLYANP